MVLKQKARIVRQKTGKYTFVLSPGSKLSDLKRREISHNFIAEDEDRLTPFEDDKLKVCKFIKLKAYWD